MERVCKFLKDAGTYYLATVEGDQPRVRPFGTAHIFEGRLYIQTGKAKPVSKQLMAHPKAEICAFHKKCSRSCGSFRKPSTRRFPRQRRRYPGVCPPSGRGAT